MTDALRYEWARLRTLRSTYWLIASALVVNAAVALLVGHATRNDTLDHEITGIAITAGGAHLPLPLAAVFMAGTGILATGHEYRYGTIQPTLTTVPQRTRLLAAKVLVVGGTALVVAIVSMPVNVAAATVFWRELPDLTDPPLDEVVPGYVVLVVLWAIAGAALGQLFRGVPSPLVVILVAPLVVEQVIFRLSYAFDWLEPVVKFLPFTSGQRLVHLSGEAAGTYPPDGLLFERWASGSVFAASVAVVLAAAWVLFKRRDA